MNIRKAGTLAVKHLSGSDNIEQLINDWFAENEDAEVVDIKITAHSSDSLFFDNALIIYRK